MIRRLLYVPDYDVSLFNNIHEKIARFWLAENSAVFP